MAHRPRRTAVVLALLLAPAAFAQTQADYDRALGLRDRYQYLATGVADNPAWVGKTSRFHYRKSVPGGHEFVLVDAETQQKRPAFDHARLAAALSKETGDTLEPLRLPLSGVTFSDDEKTLELTLEQARWKCTLADYACSKTEQRPLRPGVLRGV